MPKDALEYEAKVPAFLQRLKAGHAAQDGRNNVQIPRPSRGKIDRLKMDDEGEDEPVIVDGSGQEVSKEDMRRLGEGDSTGEKKSTSENDPDASVPRDESLRKVLKDDVVGIGGGGGRKRRAGLGKVVGGSEEDEAVGGDGGAPIKAIADSTQDLKEAVTTGKEQAKKQDSKKGKRKKIKLSFDEQD